jgi:hypothetical protein
VDAVLRETKRACLGWIGWLAAELAAQQIVQVMSGPDLCWYFSPMGDIDGDGYEDVMVASWIWVGPGINHADSELRTYSGRDGSLIRVGPRFAYPDFIFSFPHGDQNHDGVRDYISRDRNLAQNTQRLSVRSGVDDQILWSVTGVNGAYWIDDVVGNVDLDGDGELDVLVANAAGGNGQGQIWAYNHQGALLYTITGAPSPLTLAQSIAKLGDVNGDGCDDYITGLGDPFWHGAVAVISGPTGQILRIVNGQSLGDYIGSDCVGLGDVDDDGWPDFAAGGGLSGSNGSVQGFSGATGAPLFTVYSGFVGDGFGAWITACDYDRDGAKDIVALGAHGMRVVSGREGVQILHVRHQPALFGSFESMVALETPTGFPHFLAHDVLQRTVLMTTQPHHTEMLGPGCSFASPTAQRPRLGMRELNATDRRLTLSGAEPGSIAFLLLGLGSSSNGPVDLAQFGLPRCSVYPTLQTVGGVTIGSTPGSAGYARHDFTWPFSARGLRVDAQWLTLDGNFAPAGLTSGLRLVIP